LRRVNLVVPADEQEIAAVEGTKKEAASGI